MNERINDNIIQANTKLVDENKLLKEDKEILQRRINKAIEVIDLLRPELWNISNAMTYKLIDIENILKGEYIYE